VQSAIEEACERMYRNLEEELDSTFIDKSTRDLAKHEFHTTKESITESHDSSLTLIRRNDQQRFSDTQVEQNQIFEKIFEHHQKVVFVQF